MLGGFPHNFVNTFSPSFKLAIVQSCWEDFFRPIWTVPKTVDSKIVSNNVTNRMTTNV